MSNDIVFSLFFLWSLSHDTPPTPVWLYSYLQFSLLNLCLPLLVSCACDQFVDMLSKCKMPFRTLRISVEIRESRSCKASSLWTHRENSTQSCISAASGWQVHACAVASRSGARCCRRSCLLDFLSLTRVALFARPPLLALITPPLHQKCVVHLCR